MLFNPKWEPKQQDDPLSLDSLIEWLEGMPPESAYTYYSSSHCLLAKYFRAKGYRWVHVTTSNLHHGLWGKTPLPEHFNAIALGSADWQSHKFGAALRRARSARDHTRIAALLVT